MRMGEKIKQARLALNLTQSEVAAKTGISERSLYTYEQLDVMPRMGNLRTLADALSVSVAYLKNDDETNTQRELDRDVFYASVKSQYGAKGAAEANDVLERASALFAGGELDDEAKDVFFRSLMEVYIESKAEAREKFRPNRNPRAKKKSAQ